MKVMNVMNGVEVSDPSQMGRVSAILLPKRIRNKRLVWIKPPRLRDFFFPLEWLIVFREKRSFYHGRTGVNTRGCG
jgi:hypothetical protein